MGSRGPINLMEYQFVKVTPIRYPFAHALEKKPTNLSKNKNTH